MTDRSFLGEFELMVLLAILRLGERAYAVPIREEIEVQARRSVTRGALYTSLERLESKGLLTSRMSDPTPERGGRSRRYYEATPAGVTAVKQSQEALARLTKGLESVLGKTR